uniref:Macaca fascicularis brain cDNA clone: QmoA-11880, similar to human RAB33B, member RAS oncogene family (RAB33B), mRNA, RefSeq: NM_031296.1 n=1 Tax=Macaca fascicularis TaxID=9541 RepID=I7G8L6_MACFA|nr:unnamed protein product [Macaca fascicularis]
MAWIVHLAVGAGQWWAVFSVAFMSKEAHTGFLLEQQKGKSGCCLVFEVSLRSHILSLLHSVSPSES